MPEGEGASDRRCGCAGSVSHGRSLRSSRNLHPWPLARLLAAGLAAQRPLPPAFARFPRGRRGLCHRLSVPADRQDRPESCFPSAWGCSGSFKRAPSSRRGTIAAGDFCQTGQRPLPRRPSAGKELGQRRGRQPATLQRGRGGQPRRAFSRAGKRAGAAGWSALPIS